MGQVRRCGWVAVVVGALVFGWGAPGAAQSGKEGSVRSPDGTVDRPDDRIEFQVRPAGSEISVDGDLDEAAWRRAEVIPLRWETSPGDNIPAPVATECRVTFDDENLYFGCEARDPDPSAIRAFVTDRDRLGGQDRIVFAIDPFNDSRRAMEFVVNPLGVQGDRFYDEQRGFPDDSWDAIWASAGKIVAHGYRIEAAVPFRSLRFPDDGRGTRPGARSSEPTSAPSPSVREPAGGSSVLIGVTVAFGDLVFMTLGRSVAGGSTLPESGADLALRVGEELTIPLEEGSVGSCGRPVGFSCYRGRVAGRVHPGDTVRLEGRLRDGPRVRGEAVVPPVPDIRVQGGTPGDTVRGRSLSDSTVVPEVLGVKSVEGRVAVGDTVVMATVWTDGERRSCPVPLPGPPPGVDLRKGRRVGVGAAPPRCPGAPDLVWDSMAVPVTFMSYDENFTAWAAGRSTLAPAGEGGFGLDGLPGVWGAATPRTFVLVVTP